MSRMRFSVARTFIQQGEYDKAREVLRTMPDNPTSNKWLRRLDEIDPPFPEELIPKERISPPNTPTQQINKVAADTVIDEWVAGMQRLNLLIGILSFVAGIGMNAFAIHRYNHPPTYEFYGQVMQNDPSPWLILLVGVGLFLIAIGFFGVWRSGNPDGLREQFHKMKMEQLKSMPVFMGMLAVFWVILGMLTGETYHLGIGILWILVAGVNRWHYQVHEKYDRLTADSNRTRLTIA